MVAVGVISPRKLIRRALCFLLLALPIGDGLVIPFDADTIADASDRIVASKPQVLLVECDSVAGFLNCIRTAKTLSPPTRCLLLADDPEEEFSVQAVRSGAWGLVTKRADPALMQQAIEKVVRGEMWFSHGTMAKAVETFVRRKPPEDSALERLTPREAEVMALLVQGYHNREIAQRLFLSENTVRRYAETIYRKLGVNSRLEVALWYQKHQDLMAHPADRHF
jgi:DNA-binding NarL/FixJ family response regulator